MVVAGALGRFGAVLSESPMAAGAKRQAEMLHLVHGGLRQRVGSLSGGNQQKVVLGKWLEADPTLVLMNDPTRGVDVGAKSEIYRIIQSQADADKVILFHSSELTEFSLVCDRVVVFYRGRAGGRLAGRPQRITFSSKRSILGASPKCRRRPCTTEPTRIPGRRHFGAHL